MVIVALVYLAAAYYLASWIKRHFQLSATASSIRLMFFAPMLLLLLVDTLHRSLPRNFIFIVDYAISLLGFFSVCWLVIALAGELVELIARRFRPEFSLGHKACYLLIVFAGVALYAIHRTFAPFLAGGIHKEALSHLKTQNWNAAVKHYNTAILLSPGNSIFYHNRGLAYFYKGEINNALIDATKATELRGAAGFEAHMLRAGLYLCQRKYKEAAADYTKALSLKESTEAYIYRAYAHLLNSDYENAITDSTKFISLTPDYPDGYAIRGLAYRKKAVTANGAPDSKDAQAAVWDFLKACDRYDKNACDVINAVNGPDFDYAAYGETALPSLMESYRTGINSMQADLAKAGVPPPDKRDFTMVDAAPRKIVFMADYPGKVRKIPSNKLNLIISSSKNGGQEHFGSLYKKEISITSDGSALWMPIQQNLLTALKKEFRNNDKVFFYAVVIGAIGDEIVPLATEFKTIHLDGTPFFETTDKVDQHLLGSESPKRFPASVNRAAIITAE